MVTFVVIAALILLALAVSGAVSLGILALAWGPAACAAFATFVVLQRSGADTASAAGLERLTGATFVDPRVYFISELPADVRGGEVLAIAAVALALGVLATLYPAWRAARTQPAEALRHEV